MLIPASKQLEQTRDIPAREVMLPIAHLTTLTGSITLTGALMSFAGGTSVDIASGAIRYAPCVVAREFRAAIPPRAVRGRAWAELF